MLDDIAVIFGFFGVIQSLPYAILQTGSQRRYYSISSSRPESKSLPKTDLMGTARHVFKRLKDIAGF